MNLDDALDAAMSAPAVKKGPDCTMGAAMSRMPDDTRDRVLRVLMERREDGTMVSTSVIADILMAAGYPVKQEAVMRHRRTMLGRSNGCACRVP